MRRTVPAIVFEPTGGFVAHNMRLGLANVSWRKADVAALAQLRQAGVVVEEQPDRIAFRAALEPVWARWRDRLDPMLIADLMRER